MDNDQIMAVVKGGPTTEGLGGYNDMPPNWKFITVSEFLWRFGQHQKKMEFRQVKHDTVKEHGSLEITPGHKVYCDTYLWVFPDKSGVGWIVHYNGAATRSEHDAFFPQYFHWRACEHEYETVTTGNCYWEGKCKKCGYVSIVDSSG